ncbi:rap guanine nucleotide exchange factor 1 isoform X3 [Coregonus clupeaformis]|uniref:rap guanine nucleotide exchange factor 1 isoform X3 n=1 Tax=Coregonus clupeaformis TaxID=59861 RepID=UPI001E1C9D78|nr:rap guanine nucleotide exchange factor 1 isoform X3 [Coregonus clupeaformis]
MDIGLHKQVQWLQSSHGYRPPQTGTVAPVLPWVSASTNRYSGSSPPMAVGLHKQVQWLQSSHGCRPPQTGTVAPVLPWLSASTNRYSGSSPPMAVGLHKQVQWLQSSHGCRPPQTGTVAPVLPWLSASTNRYSGSSPPMAVGLHKQVQWLQSSHGCRPPQTGTVAPVLPWVSASTNRYSGSSPPMAVGLHKQVQWLQSSHGCRPPQTGTVAPVLPWLSASTNRYSGSSPPMAVGLHKQVQWLQSSHGCRPPQTGTVAPVLPWLSASTNRYSGSSPPMAVGLHKPVQWLQSSHGCRPPQTGTVAPVLPWLSASTNRYSGSSPPMAVGLHKQEYEVDALQRRFSGGSHYYGGESPRLSPCNSMGKLSKSDEQLSWTVDSGQCSRNTSSETLDTTDHYDPDYDFLHQDLSSLEHMTPVPVGGCLSPLPEFHSESSSPCPGPGPPLAQPHFSLPSPQPSFQGSSVSPLYSRMTPAPPPPALPEKKRRGGACSGFSDSSYSGSSWRVSFERHPSQYDNLMEEDLPPVPPFPLFTSNISPLCNAAGGFVSEFSASETTDVPQSPPPLPEKKSRHILKYMQFVEDYSEPQPSVFYQMPQSESIYEQRNKRFQEVYGFNDSFSSSDSVHEPLPPPALPPKQRQLASHSASSSSSSSSSLSCHLQQSQAAVVEEETGAALSMSVSNSFLSRQASLTTPMDSSAIDDSLEDTASENTLCNNKDMSDDSRRQKSSEEGQSSEETDELSLIDHMEIMSRLTLKQENDDGPDVRAGSGDILLVHATETDRKDLVLYCEAFLTTYRTFITPEDLIKKLHYRYTRFCHCPDTFKKKVSKNTFFVLVRVVDELCLVEMTEDILKQLMDLVFRLVCNGELSLARVLRKNILDKVEQRKLLRYTYSLKPLAARGVAARPGTLHDFRSHEIADQLTLLDAELFYKIEIPEVLLWAKEQNEEKSANLTQFTEHFNNMSYWVRSIIILQEKAQDREKLLLKFIKIMKHLRKLNNFNSYLAILSALDSAPIRRLEWQKTTSEGLEEYCTLIDSSSSFRAYRAALSDVESPCIPYLGLILQDLTFVHLGNPDLINGKVNFSKRWQQFNILDSMRRFQQVHYDLKHNDDIVSFFNDFSDHLAEEALWELSLKIKPRNITRRKTDREEKT